MKKLLLPLLLLIIWTSQYAEKKDEIPLHKKYAKEYFRAKNLSSGLSMYLEEYYVTVPDNLDFFAVDKDKLYPMFLRYDDELVEKDSFGFPLHIRIVNHDVWVASSGSDGVFKGWDQTGSYSFKKLSGQDIIFRNGISIYPAEILAD